MPIFILLQDELLEMLEIDSQIQLQNYRQFITITRITKF